MVKFGTPNFIGIYDDALSSSQCKELISEFEKSSLMEGVVNIDGVTKIDPSVKKCIQLKDPNLLKESIITNIIKDALGSCLEKYKKEYISLEHQALWHVDEEYSFKRFKTEDDGFKKWHTEHGSGKDSMRILVWQFYLNNAQAGTEFMHFPTIRAKMGRCIVWPAGWSHTHRSEPNKGLKYIVSGWCSFH